MRYKHVCACMQHRYVPPKMRLYCVGNYLPNCVIQVYMYCTYILFCDMLMLVTIYQNKTYIEYVYLDMLKRHFHQPSPPPLKHKTKRVKPNICNTTSVCSCPMHSCDSFVQLLFDGFKRDYIQAYCVMKVCAQIIKICVKNFITCITTSD